MAKGAREFSSAAATTSRETLHSKPVNGDFKYLRVNGSRLMDTLHYTCKWGQAHRYGQEPTETGMDRLSLNDDDNRVRLWLIDQVKMLGCKITVDEMGNIFAVRPGKNAEAPPVMMGSHLDTQPTGGRYDGILGVHTALEVLKTIHGSEYQTEGPVGLVNWTNEEGARFPMVTVASGVWAGAIPLQTAWDCLEVTAPANGSTRRTMKEELERIGFLGSVPASYQAQPIAAHFEVHIEQGPVLEQEARKVGIVTGAQAYRWFDIAVKGRDSHAGTTPFSARRDALLAAAKMIVASNQLAKEALGLVTTGILTAQPGSVNTMAHTVRFTLDIRHPSDAQLSALVDNCREEFDRIAREDCESGVEVEWTCLTENKAAIFHPDCIAAVEESAMDTCAQVHGSSPDHPLWRRMVSGASHDSVQVNKRCPTAMIFAPTRNGLSHTPIEYCSPEDCTISAQVLLGAVLRYDKARSESGDLVL